jgi:hypothetical protein
VTQNDDGTFTRSCHALADFDNVAPTARITKAVVLPSRRAVQTTFTTSDDVAGNAVSYRLSVTAAGHALAHATGSTPGGAVSKSLGVKIPKRTKRVVVALKVSDPLHNARTVTRSARVPR